MAEDVSLPELGEGDALLRVSYLSIAPTVGAWVCDARSYFPPVAIREVLRCSGVGTVVESRVLPRTPRAVSGSAPNMLFAGDNLGKLVVAVNP